MSVDGDDVMLAAYRSGLEYGARRIREMGGDPEHPTEEQAKAVAEELIARAMLLKHLTGDETPLPTATEIMRDNREMRRMKKRRDH